MLGDSIMKPNKPLIKAIYSFVFFVGFFIAIYALFSYEILDNFLIEILVISFVELLITSIYFLILKLTGNLSQKNIESWQANAFSFNIPKLSIFDFVRGGKIAAGCIVPLLSGGLLGILGLILLIFLGMFLLKYVFIYIIMRLAFEFLIIFTNFKPVNLSLISLVVFIMLYFNLNINTENNNMNNMNNMINEFEKNDLEYVAKYKKKWCADEDTAWYIVDNKLYKSNLTSDNLSVHQDLNIFNGAEIIEKNNDRIYVYNYEKFGYIDINSKTEHIIGFYNVLMETHSNSKIVIHSNNKNKYNLYEFYLYDLNRNDFVDKENPIIRRNFNIKDRIYVYGNDVYFYDSDGKINKNNIPIYTMEKEEIRSLSINDEFIAITTTEKTYIINNDDYTLKTTVDNEDYDTIKINEKYFLYNNDVYMFSIEEEKFISIFANNNPIGKINSFDLAEDHFFFWIDDRCYYSHNENTIEIFSYYKTSTHIYLLLKEDNKYIIKRKII